FFAAVERLQTMLDKWSAEPEPLKPLESVWELSQLPNMTHDQIAKIYGLVDRHGVAQGWKVTEALKAHGQDAGKDWQAPVGKKQEAAVVAAAADHKRKLAEKHRVSREAKSGATERKPCPETPRELWEQGVSVAQSAKMLCVSEAEVEAMWIEFAKDG